MRHVVLCALALYGGEVEVQAPDCIMRAATSLGLQTSAVTIEERLCPQDMIPTRQHAQNTKLCKMKLWTLVHTVVIGHMAWCFTTNDNVEDKQSLDCMYAITSLWQWLEVQPACIQLVRHNLTLGDYPAP